jgi:hypothetical protein
MRCLGPLLLPLLPLPLLLLLHLEVLVVAGSVVVKHVTMVKIEKKKHTYGPEDVFCVFCARFCRHRPP